MKVNISGMHKILPSGLIISSILDEKVLGRKGKYINDPCILKEVSVIDVFLEEISQMLELDISNYLHCPLYL